jgi:hypothetical protein
MHHAFIQFLVDRDLISPSASKRLSSMRTLIPEPIGMIAVGHGLLQAREIDLILERQRHCSERFGEIAADMGFLNAGQVETLVKIQEFRTTMAICEALALANILTYEKAFRYLGAWLAGDDEVIAMLSGSETSAQV